MGFSYRKSVKMGPFRVTASKSGISYSAGVKGVRVTKRANGKVQTTLSAPGTGFRYTTVSGTKRGQARRPAASTPVPAKRPVPTSKAASRPSQTPVPQIAARRPVRLRGRRSTTAPRIPPRTAAAVHEQGLPGHGHCPPGRHPHRADARRHHEREPLGRHRLGRADRHRLPGGELLSQRSCPLRHLRRPARPDVHRQRQPHGRERPQSARHPVHLAAVTYLPATP